MQYCAKTGRISICSNILAKVATCRSGYWGGMGRNNIWPYGQGRSRECMETGGGGTEASEQAISSNNLIWPFKGLECGINI